MPPSQAYKVRRFFWGATFSLLMTSLSNFAHSSLTSGIPIFLSISSVFMLLSNFKGSSNLGQRLRDVLVHSRRADAQHRGRLLVSHLVVVMQLQNTPVLLRQVTVDHLLKLLHQLIMFSLLALGHPVLHLQFHASLQLSLLQQMQTLIAGGRQQIASDALTAYLGLVLPDKCKHLVHSILGIVSILNQREGHAIHVWIVVLEQVFKRLFVVVHTSVLVSLFVYKTHKRSNQIPLIAKKLLRLLVIIPYYIYIILF